MISEVDSSLCMLIVWILFIAAFATTFVSPMLAKLAAYGKLSDLPRNALTSSSLLLPFANIWLMGMNQALAWQLFYAYASLLNACLLYFYFKNNYDYYTITSLPWTLILMQLQVMRRFYETIAVHKFSVRLVKMPLILVAFGYYTLACLSTFIYESSRNNSSSGIEKKSLLRLAVTIVVFVYGSYNQYKSHVILAQLRNNKSDNSATPQFGIPHGGWYSHVSSPHYMSEIILYGSFLIWGEFKAMELWGMFMFVCVNLTSSAIQTHGWYLDQFKEKYSQLQRKAIIPYVL